MTRERRPPDPLPRRHEPSQPGADDGHAPPRAGTGVGRSGRQRLDMLGPAGGPALPPALSKSPSAVPDVLAPGLRVVFCGINPGLRSAEVGAHFANPRNDFWRLLHEAGFTPRVLAPSEQHELPAYGCGVTNAAHRTTRGSGDLRSADFAGARERLERIAVELRPRAVAFVGKEAYRGIFGERPALGRQPRLLEDTILFVLPSTSPANAAVPYAERRRWFRALDAALPEPEVRAAARALVLDASGRALLVRYVSPMDAGEWWVLPGGAVDEGETTEEALRRELREEAALEADPGPCVWTREFVFPYGERWYRQQERIHLVGVDAHDPPEPVAALRAEGVHELRWWTAGELEESDARFAPRRLPSLLRRLLESGPPVRPVDIGP